VDIVSKVPPELRRRVDSTDGTSDDIERSIERRCQVLILELKGGLRGLECGGVAVGRTDEQVDDGSSTSALQPKLKAL
jgi:hypothetical protein